LEAAKAGLSAPYVADSLANSKTDRLSGRPSTITTAAANGFSSLTTSPQLFSECYYNVVLPLSCKYDGADQVIQVEAAELHRAETEEYRVHSYRPPSGEKHERTRETWIGRVCVQS
jgi:hypothetical protein